MELNGVIVINKPQDMTSHDVVAILRKKLKTKKWAIQGHWIPWQQVCFRCVSEEPLN